MVASSHSLLPFCTQIQKPRKEDFTDIPRGNVSKKTISQTAPVFVFTAIKIYNNKKLYLTMSG